MTYFLHFFLTIPGILVGRCLLLPSFRRETEGTDCTWIQLPSNYDPRRMRKSTTRRWRTARRPLTRRRFTSNQQCMVPIEQSYYVKDHYCNAHYQIASSKHTILCHWLNMLLCVRCQEKKIITTDTVERFAKFVGVYGSQKIVFMPWLVGHFFVNHRRQRYKDCTSWWFLQHSKPNKGSSGSACCKTRQWKSFAMFNWSSRKEVIPLVSYPARWSF